MPRASSQHPDPPTIAVTRRVNALPRCIIVPVALPHDARAVVEIAAAFAGALGAELVLAGIAPLAPPEPQSDGLGAIAPATAQVERQQLVDGLVGEQLQELTDELPGDVRVRTVVTWGAVGPSLVAAAREQHADLIVAPMLREGELRHLLHDHADRHVLHHSDVPVLLVPVP
jgi:nucleotide-binding universal stress UspA family protein